MRTWETTSTRMARLVQELMDVSTIQVGAPLILRRTSTELLGLVRAEVADLQVLEQARIVVEAPDGPVVGDWDAQRVQRVIDNLVANALKYGATAAAVRRVTARRRLVC